MDLKTYRQQKNLKQSELAEELQTVCPGIDAFLISKIENGWCKPNDAVQHYIDGYKTPSVPCEEDLYGRNLTSLHDTLYRLIADASSSKPVSRGYLARRLKVTDRTLRRMIQDLRMAGCWICNTNKTGGYWLCENEAEKKALMDSYYSRELACRFTRWALMYKKDPYKK